MPPKKSVKKIVPELDEIQYETISNSVIDSILNDQPISTNNTSLGSIGSVNNSKTVSTISQSPSPMYMSSSSKNSDKIQLIQAINNFTLKGEELLSAMKKFDIFKEEVSKYDLLINTKREEYSEVLKQLEQNYNTKVKNFENEYIDHEQNVTSKFKTLNKNLEMEYNDLNKSLQNKYVDSNKKLDDDYTDKHRILANEFKNDQISVKQKLSEFKYKACEEFLKDISVTMIKTDEYINMQTLVSKTNTELSDLKKSFDKECDKIKYDEKHKYDVFIENENKLMKLTSDVMNANMKAQVEQQSKEIHVLQNQIENLKHELSEQRSLTKEVAQASSKSQISQNFGK